MTRGHTPGFACHHTSHPCPASANSKGKRRYTRITSDAHGWRACTGCASRMCVNVGPARSLHWRASLVIRVYPRFPFLFAESCQVVVSRGDFPAPPICRPVSQGMPSAMAGIQFTQPAGDETRSPRSSGLPRFTPRAPGIARASRLLACGLRENQHASLIRHGASDLAHLPGMRSCGRVGLVATIGRAVCAW